MDSGILFCIEWAKCKKDKADSGKKLLKICRKQVQKSPENRTLLFMFFDKTLDAALRINRWKKLLEKRVVVVIQAQSVA